LILPALEAATQRPDLPAWAKKDLQRKIALLQASSKGAK
jgi:hypothetical protein